MLIFFFYSSNHYLSTYQMEMRWIYYFILLFANQFFNTMLVSYSSVKHTVSQQFNFTESFLGVIDMVSMLGRLIASIYIILFPSEKINRTFFICTLIQTFAIIIIASSHLMKGIAELLFIVGMLVFGLGRGVFAFPYLLLSPIFNRPEDICAVNAWYGLGSFGTSYSFLLYIWFKDSFDLHWTLILLIIAFLNLFFTSLAYKVVPEVEREQPAVGACEEIQISKNVIKEHYQRQTSNWLLLIDFVFRENMMFMFLFWAPYFFNKEGFGEKAEIIGLCFPIGSLLGAITLNPIISLCPSFTPKITCIFDLLEFLLFLSFFFIKVNTDNFAIYLAIFGAIFTLHIVSFSKQASNQITEKTENNEEKYLIINFMRLVRELWSAISLLLTGIILNQNLMNIWIVFLVHFGIGFFFHLVRRTVEYHEKQKQT